MLIGSTKSELDSSSDNLKGFDRPNHALNLELSDLKNFNQSTLNEKNQIETNLEISKEET